MEVKGGGRGGGGGGGGEEGSGCTGGRRLICFTYQPEKKLSKDVVYSLQ